MKLSFTKFLAVGSLALLLSQPALLQASDMGERIDAATQLLADKQASSSPIPASVLDNAKGVAFFSVTKAGLGIGGQGGEGIVVVHRGTKPLRSWTAPSAFNLGGATVGAQIGFTETHYIVILNTDDAVRHFSSPGKTTFAATATGTAGGENATEKATTTELEHRDLVVYKASEGVFGGATLGGTSVERKNGINRQAYGESVRTQDILDGKVTAPKSTERLYRLLDGKA